MTITTDRKPLALPGGHRKVLWHSCGVCSLRDIHGHRAKSGRERIPPGVKCYGDDDSRGEA